MLNILLTSVLRSPRMMRSNRFAAQVVTVRGGHQRSLLGFISLLYVLTLTSRAIKQISVRHVGRFLKGGGDATAPQPLLAECQPR